MENGCGKLTKGSDPKDSLVACGTKVWFLVDEKSVKETRHLCEECKKVDKSPEV
jgi:hypothetical protein